MTLQELLIAFLLLSSIAVCIMAGFVTEFFRQKIKTEKENRANSNLDRAFKLIDETLKTCIESYPSGEIEVDKILEEFSKCMGGQAMELIYNFYADGDLWLENKINQIVNNRDAN